MSTIAVYNWPTHQALQDKNPLDTSSLCNKSRQDLDGVVKFIPVFPELSKLQHSKSYVLGDPSFRWNRIRKHILKTPYFPAPNI